MLCRVEDFHIPLEFTIADTVWYVWWLQDVPSMIGSPAAGFSWLLSTTIGDRDETDHCPPVLTTTHASPAPSLSFTKTSPGHVDCAGCVYSDLEQCLAERAGSLLELSRRARGRV